ncbi:MAG: hypothetical protein WCV63_08990 [Negativicutes bacterium]|jgi:hypothetical protein
MNLRGEYVIIISGLLLFVDYFAKPQGTMMQIAMLIANIIWLGVIIYDLFKRFTRKSKRNRRKLHN